MIPGEEYDEEIPETYHMVLPDHDDTFGTKPTPQPSLVPATKFIKVSPYDDEYSYPSSYFGQPFRHNHTFIDDSLEPIDNSLLVVGGTQLPVAGSVDGPSFVVGNPVRPVTGDRLVFTDVPSTRDNSRYGVGPTNDAATSETFPYVSFYLTYAHFHNSNNSF